MMVTSYCQQITRCDKQSVMFVKISGLPTSLPRVYHLAHDCY